MRGRRACCVALVAVVAHALDEHLFYDLTDGRATFKVAAGYKHILGWIAVKRSERLVSAWVHAAMAATPAGEAGTMLDIGANAGYFGLMSIALGGRAVFFDPQPACWAAIDSALQVNQFADRGWIVRHPLASSAAPKLFDVTGTTCKGTYPLVIGKGGRNSPDAYGSPMDKGRKGRRRYVETTTLEAAAARLPESIGAAVRDGPIQMVKVDVEGAEIGLLRHNLLPLFRERRVRHCVVEVTPTAWRFAANTSFADALRMGARLIMDIAAYGYVVHSRYARASAGHAGPSGVSEGPSGPLAPLELTAVANETALIAHLQRIRKTTHMGQEDLHFSLREDGALAPAAHAALEMVTCCAVLRGRSKAQCACNITQHRALEPTPVT